MNGRNIEDGILKLETGGPPIGEEDLLLFFFNIFLGGLSDFWYTFESKVEAGVGYARTAFLDVGC